MIDHTADGAAAAGAGSRPAPVRLRPEVLADLVDRIRTAFRTRQPILIVVYGEAGTGKSRLCREIAAEVAPDRTIIQTSVAAEAHMSMVAIGDFAEAVAAFTHDAAPEPPPAPPTIPALGMHWRQRIERACADGPLLMIFDDTQWMDEDSFEVFGFTMRRMRDVPLVAIATRRVPARASNRLLGDSDAFGAPIPFRRMDVPNRTEVELVAPPVDLVGAAVRELVPSLSPAVAQQIAEHAGGNVFWARELARVVRADGGYDVTLTSPVARDRLAGLAEELGPDLRLLVATIQLAGRPTTAELTAALGGEIDDAAALIDRAETQGVIELAGQRWTTSHPLLGEAALEVLGPVPRNAVLRRLADVVADPERRARMVAELERPPHEPTAELLAQAAEAAAERGSLIAAAELMSRAILFTEETDSARRGARQAAMVGIHLRRGAFGRVLETAEGLDLVGLTPSAFDTVATAVADAAMFTGGHGAAQAMVARVESAAEHRGDDMSRAVALALSADRDYGTAADRYAAAVRAEAVLRTAPWPSPAHHRVLVALCLFGIDRGDGLDPELVARARAIEPGLRRVGLMRPSTDSVDALSAYIGFQLGDPGSSKRRLPHLIEQADRNGEEFAGFALRVYLAMAHHSCGEFTLAGPILAEAEQSIAKVPAPLFPPLLLARTWQALADDGPEVSGRIVTSEIAAAPGGQLRWRMCADYLDASNALVEGRGADAIEMLVRARTAAERLGLVDPGRRYLLDILLAEAHFLTGDLDTAQAVVKELLAFARPRGRLSLIAPGERMAAMIDARRGDVDGAAALLHESIERLAASPYRIEHSRSLTALASVERLRRRTKAAGALLDQATALCEAMPFEAGLVAIRREREAIAGMGEQVLTPSERQIAETVAGGATARETGEMLHISHRTVEAHLRSIYRKLGVAGRVGLTALVHRGELDSD